MNGNLTRSNNWRLLQKKYRSKNKPHLWILSLAIFLFQNHQMLNEIKSLRFIFFSKFTIFDWIQYFESNISASDEISFQPTISFEVGNLGTRAENSKTAFFDWIKEVQKFKKFSKNGKFGARDFWAFWKKALKLAQLHCYWDNVSSIPVTACIVLGELVVVI